MVGSTADQDEATITIFAFDIAGFVDFEPDTRMAEGGGHVSRSVAGDAGAVNADGFGRGDHARRLAIHDPIV